MEQEIIDFLEEHVGTVSDNYSIKGLSESLQIKNTKKIAAIVCNLEDEEIMEDIANGDYDTLDVTDACQFNDSYKDMIYSLIIDENFESEDEKKFENIQDWIDNTDIKEKEKHLREYFEYNGDSESLAVVDNLLFDEDNIPRGHLDEEMLVAEFDLDMDFFIGFVNQLDNE